MKILFPVLPFGAGVFAAVAVLGGEGYGGFWVPAVACAVGFVVVLVKSRRK